jgi:hypothetical protein
MAPATDIWFVRLPDGRVFRSRSTAALLRQLHKGRIPRGSRVRRARTDGWRPLEEVRELSEQPPQARPNGQPTRPAPARPRGRSRTDVGAWGALGVRGLMRELFDALDSSLHRGKLALACVLGVLACVAGIAWRYLDAALDGWWWVAAGSLLAVAGVLVGSLIITWITQITFIELSRLRQPRPGELVPDGLGHAVRLALTLLLVVGAGVALIVGLRWLPGWIESYAEEPGSWWHYGAAAALIARLVLEVMFWPMLALAPLLLGPILVVEECSAPRALIEWWRMLRRHLGRIFLYEALAGALALVFTAPLVAPILLAGAGVNNLTGMQLEVGQATLMILGGIALTPMLAYLLVANVFIYLNLRYEFVRGAR